MITKLSSEGLKQCSYQFLSNGCMKRLNEGQFCISLILSSSDVGKSIDVNLSSAEYKLGTLVNMIGLKLYNCD